MIRKNEMMPAKPNPYRSPLYPGTSAFSGRLSPRRAIRWVDGLGKLLILHAFVQPLTALVGIAYFFPSKLASYPGIIAGFLLLILLMNLLSGHWVSQFKGSLFCLATLLLGLANILTLFAALPTICVSAFGLFVLTRPTVRKAFAMREAGQSKNSIIDHFETLDPISDN